MAYVVDFKKPSAELLLGLVNYEHNPNNIPHQDAWPKAKVHEIQNPETSIHGEVGIAPAIDFATMSSRFIVKKDIGVEGGLIEISLIADDRAHVYIDGSLVWSPWSETQNWVTRHQKTFNLTPGRHIFAFEIPNNVGSAFVKFSITEDGVPIEVSDASWPCLELANGVSAIDYTKVGWNNLLPEEVAFIKPPIVVPDESYELTGSVALAALGDATAFSNHIEKYWPRAAIHGRNESDSGIYKLAHPTSQYLSPTPQYAPPRGRQFAVSKRVNIPSGVLKVGCSVDDYAVLFIDGVMQPFTDDDWTFDYRVTTKTYNVSPGEHKITFVALEYPGNSPCHINFAIWDNDTLVDVSDATWGCVETSDPRYVDCVARIEHTFKDDETFVFNAHTVGDSEDYKNILDTEITDLPGEDSKVVQYVNMDHDDVSWKSAVRLINPPKNTQAVVRSKSELYGVKDVEFHYDRIDIDHLFSLTGVEVREIEIDMNAGSAVLNDRIFTEINRRYGVNFTSDEFALYTDGQTLTLQAEADSLAYIGMTEFTIIHSLATRVPNAELAGFNKDNVVLV